MSRSHPHPPMTDPDEPPDEDVLVRFLLRQAPVRGEAVSLDAAWRTTLEHHIYPPAVRRQLGELCAAGMLLSASLKFEGTLILHIHGDGPVALLVVECTDQGHFRATAQVRDAAACHDDADLSSLVNRQGRGRFVLTLDPRTDSPQRQAYQGIVAFEGRTVAEVLERYMARSEQVPTRLWLAADDRRAAGVLLQKLPESSPSQHAAAIDTDAWGRLQQLAETLTPEELLAVPYGTVIHRLFWQETLEALDYRRVGFACRCSRAKVAAMLKMWGEEEIQAIVAEQEAITVRCEFCQAPYEFDAIDSARLFLSEAAGPDSKARH